MRQPSWKRENNYEIDMNVTAFYAPRQPWLWSSAQRSVAKKPQEKYQGCTDATTDAPHDDIPPIDNVWRVSGVLTSVDGPGAHEAKPREDRMHNAFLAELGASYCPNQRAHHKKTKTRDVVPHFRHSLRIVFFVLLHLKQWFRLGTVGGTRCHIPAVIAAASYFCQ